MAAAKKQKPPKTFTLTIDRTEYADDPDRFVVHKSRGVRSGIGICAFVGELLKVNEQLAVSRKMTDEDIRRVIINEFPHRLGKPRSSVQRLYERKIGVWYYRSLYNVGHLTGTRPKEKSKEYDNHGRIIQNPRLLRARPGRTVRQLLEEKKWGLIAEGTGTEQVTPG